MQNARFLILGLILAWLPSLACAAEPSNSARKARALVIMGGHEFEHDAFFQGFNDRRQCGADYLQSGHDHTGDENPNDRRILSQAMLWVAR